MQPIKRGFALIELLIIIAIVAVLCAIAVPRVKAQDAPAVPWYKQPIGFAQGAADAKAVSVALYPSYAPDLVVDHKKAPWGFGLAAFYPVLQDTGVPDLIANHTFVGGRIDYLAGSFWAPSVTLGAKANFQVFTRNCTAFTLGGTVIPMAGAGSGNGDVGTLLGGGVNINLITKGNVSLDAFAATERWSNVPGMIYHAGIKVTASF